MNIGPAPILTTRDNWFAWKTMDERLPKNIRAIAGHPEFSPSITRNLLNLADGISGDQPLEELGLPSWDYESWNEEFRPHIGKTWHSIPWFFGETYAFRLILEKSRYFENSIDPFGLLKQAELNSGAPFAPIVRFLSSLSPDGKNCFRRNSTQKRVNELSREGRLAIVRDALHLCMWGNKADLSFVAGGPIDHSQGDSELLLVNNDLPAAELLVDSSDPIHIIMDNSGAELAGDLILALTLVLLNRTPVVLHPKAYPTYVSDTTVRDIHHFLSSAQGFFLDSTNPNTLDRGAVDQGYGVPDTGGRDSLEQNFVPLFRECLDGGMISLAPDDYWCRTKFMNDMPIRISRLLSGGGLVIVKGDFNYRRAMGDTIWEPHITGRVAMGFEKDHLVSPKTGKPVPFLFLRTMKSDCLAGVDSEILDPLDEQDPGWRIQGRRGLIQLV